MPVVSALVEGTVSEFLFATPWGSEGSLVELSGTRQGCEPQNGAVPKHSCKARTICMQTSASILCTSVLCCVSSRFYLQAHSWGL